MAGRQEGSSVTLYHWLGADAERVWSDHVIEEARAEAERMRHLAEEIDE